jgi:hypothetical protein
MSAPVLPFFLLHAGRVTERTLLDPSGLRVRDREGFQADLNRLSGSEVVIGLLEVHQAQAPNPRRYYRGCVIPIIATEYMGEVSYDDAHDRVAYEFLRVDDDPETGEPRRRSTARAHMSDAEFRWYLERVIAWATIDCGLIIPEPTSVGYRWEIREDAA